jgi:PKD repeat protein
MADYSGQVNTQITFTDESTGNPTNFGWDFGDGTQTVNTAQRVVSHSYTVTGIFTITHTATNTCGTSTCTSTIEILEAPTNIVATAITPSVTTCVEPCNLTVDITWKNNGGISGTFTPIMTVNGVATILPNESLGPGSYITKTFSLTGLTARAYNICSIPNTFPCATVTVLTPANIISSTLTVDTNDCTAPCTVNGMVSWINTGGSPGTLYPTILINTVSTSIGSAVQINPGETLQYTFQLPNLIAGTYDICAQPDSGTSCQTIIVRSTGANIVATAITPSVTTCTEPCSPTVNITWTNTGTVSGTFTPTIVVDGVSTSLASETIDPLQYITKTFTIPNLIKGSHTVCANPDTGVTCVTITVGQVAQAGFGGAGMIIMAGLAIGAIYASKKSKMRQ